MTAPINSIPEAYAELVAVKESIARLEAYFAQLQAMLGGGGAPVTRKPSTAIVVEGVEEVTMVQHVLSCLNALKRPASPKEIVQYITDMGLTAPAGGKLYSSVFNTLKYLTRKNNPPVERVGEGQYKLTPAA